MLGGLLLMFMQVNIWKALYSQGVTMSSTLNESVTYMIMSSVVLTTLRLQPGVSMGKSVYSGDVGAEMVRPINLLAQHCAHEMGKAMFLLASYVMPTIVFGLILFDVFTLPSSFIDFLLFIISTVFASIICLLINAIFGYSAFWLYNNWYVIWVEGALLAFFGGTLLPIWFYPEIFDTITKFLPFRYACYEPINFYLGNIQGMDIVVSFAVQITWIVILVLLERFVWYKAQRKIVIQGG